MKKSYQKPMLFAEDFQLYEHISAGSCYVNKDVKVQAGYLNGESCLYWDDNIAIYTYPGNCTDAMNEWLDTDLGMNGNNPETWGQACYNAFSQYSLAFVS